jgi:hypothetical protein
MKDNTKNLHVHKWIILVIIIIFILVGSLSSILFPGTAFETIIDSSIGKFFDVIGLVKNNYINILERLAIN